MVVFREKDDYVIEMYQFDSLNNHNIKFAKNDTYDKATVKINFNKRGKKLWI